MQFVQLLACVAVAQVVAQPSSGGQLQQFTSREPAESASDGLASVHAARLALDAAAGAASDAAPDASEPGEHAQDFAAADASASMREAFASPAPVPAEDCTGEGHVFEEEESTLDGCVGRVLDAQRQLTGDRVASAASDAARVASDAARAVAYANASDAAYALADEYASTSEAIAAAVPVPSWVAEADYNRQMNMFYRAQPRATVLQWMHCGFKPRPEDLTRAAAVVKLYDSIFPPMPRILPPILVHDVTDAPDSAAASIHASGTPAVQQGVSVPTVASVARGQSWLQGVLRATQISEQMSSSGSSSSSTSNNQNPQTIPAVPGPAAPEELCNRQKRPHGTDIESDECASPQKKGRSE